MLPVSDRVKTTQIRQTEGSDTRVDDGFVSRKIFIVFVLFGKDPYMRFIPDL